MNTVQAFWESVGLGLNEGQFEIKVHMYLQTRTMN